MNENMKCYKDCCLQEGPWVEIMIDADFFDMFEAFCTRNKIPFNETRRERNVVVCLIRNGIDAQDVYSYLLREAINPDDKEMINLIYSLWQLRVFFSPKYEYEYDIFRTEADGDLLDSFEY